MQHTVDHSRMMITINEASDGFTIQYGSAGLHFLTKIILTRKQLHNNFMTPWQYRLGITTVSPKVT